MARGIGQESPPASFATDQQDFLTRRFIDVGTALGQSNHFTPRKEMPYKPQIGHVYYFNDPTGAGYDAVITAEGLWVYKSTGYTFIA
jgi:hypothetical protein